MKMIKIIIMHTLLLLYTDTCDLPSQLLERPVIVDSGSQEIPHREGQFITYTCPPGLILAGQSTLVSTGYREWEPDPREVDCIGDYTHNMGNGCINLISYYVMQLTVEYHSWTEMSN
jgi:hypothetical protein